MSTILTSMTPMVYALAAIVIIVLCIVVVNLLKKQKNKPKLTKEEKVEERERKAQAKIDLKQEIAEKKAQWKKEDELADAESYELIEQFKKVVAESKVEFDEITLARKENPEDLEIEEQFYEIQKKHERNKQRLRIEQDRVSLSRKIERWSKRGSRLRRELYNKRQYYYLVTPYVVLFTAFTVIPVLLSFIISFTYFNLLEFPTWVGWENYMRLFIDDKVFTIAIRNTLILAVVTGPLSYLSAFVFAWLINEFKPKLRAFLTLIFYAPSISGNVYLVWKLIFSSDMYGYANSILMRLSIIDEPITWLQDSTYIIWIIMIVQLWLSLGVSFLAFIAGLQSCDKQLYEAGSIDGIRNRWQELWYITLPQMKSQLMFGAVMQITSSLSVAAVATQIAGFPSIEYAGHTIITHLMDYGSLRLEMGYASAIATILFLFMIGANLLVRKILRRVGS